AFLQRHPDNTWMLKSLIPLFPSSEEKENGLVIALGRYPDLSRDSIEVRRSRQRQARAATERDAEVLQELFATRDPAVLRSLARNPHTPEPLLQGLAALKELKGAREIRGLAKEALRRRSR